MQIVNNAGRQQFLGAASITGTGVEDVARLILIEHADGRSNEI
jgi:hypothetical protein